jgi:hypothetical protein
LRCANRLAISIQLLTDCSSFTLHLMRVQQHFSKNQSDESFPPSADLRAKDAVDEINLVLAR